MPLVSYNGCIASINAIDNAGNIYIGGQYQDSLVYEGKQILKAKSQYAGSFLMKLDNNNKFSWVNQFGAIGNLYFNESRNSFYISHSIDKAMNTVVYNNNDSLVFLANPNYFRTIISEFSSVSGQLKQYTTFLQGGDKGFNLIQLKGNNKTLILNQYTLSSGLSKIKIGTDSFSFMLSGSSTYSNNFIIGFNPSTLKHKFINFFDSCITKLSITSVYNDSLYSIFGTSIGNQNFRFVGGAAPAKDYLKTRPLSFPSDFIATYTTTNMLKDVWYLTKHPTNTYSSFQTLNYKPILENKGDLYIAGTIQYHSELGLGKREFNYAGGSRSVTILKYNCKPTAYFSYTQANNKVTFKNLSTGLINYTWLFGKNNDKATTKDAVYDYPKTGSVFYPMLIASNSCGNDTFSVAITIASSSVSKLDKINVSVYPNPANSKITVQFENKLNSKNLQFTLYDMCGKSLVCPFIKIDGTQYELDVQAISNGIYSLSVQNEGFNVLQKVTVLK